MTLILFDCDGTLVDSAHVIHDCMGRSFRDFDLPVPESHATRSIIGLSLETAIARLLDREIDESVLAVTARYKHHFALRRGEADFSEPLYDEIREMLSALADRHDVTLGLVTGKSRRGLSAVLATHELAGFFAVSRTADDCPSKPHPAMVLECCAETASDPTDTIVVGDAVYDMEMAKAAGAIAMGVSWGYAPPASLTVAGADDILATPGQLLRYLDPSRERDVAHARSAV